ncbi:hypothetical protein [Priestia megaterium]|uniref:hypothetical protein n=1 Tax=Priestia megaterium TaxID=1404 RepID=UPI002E200821|nr:hypothetical protein [Priestia megaterium]
MANFSKETAKKFKAQVLGTDADTVGNKMAKHLADHFNAFHGLQHRRNDKEIESLLLKQTEHEVKLIDSEPTYPKVIIKYNPSGASKCNLELFQIAIGIEQVHDDKYPYHDRWTRNATAVHEATQRDLLYAQKYLPNTKFTVELTEDGLPAWEQNILTWKVFEHKGQRFVINGMMDGILKYIPEDKKIGFEFKTKSSTIGQVGYYKMKDIQEAHKMQGVAYSLLFGIDDFVFMYESLAKDGWTKGAEAKPDFRVFHLHVTEEMRQELLDKFAYVASCVEAGVEPAEELDKCFFCGFKYICHEGGES